MSPELPSPTARGVGLYRWNPARLELTWDRTAASIFAADPAADAFEVWRSMVHPDDHDRVLETFARPTQVEDVYRIIMEDGSTHHVLSRVTGIIDDEAEQTTVTGVMIDVTESREADAMLGVMLDSISDGFIILDREYRVTYLNKQAAVILGASAIALRGRILWDAFPDAGDLFRESYAKAMDERVPVEFEAYYPAPLDLWLDVRAQPSSHGILVYFQDATERRTKEIERERLLESERRARTEADEALRLAETAQRELAYQAAHDGLTDLMNRAEFERVAAARLARGSAEGRPVTAMFLDLDRFKLVNDSLGHAVGDALLVEIAARIQRIVGRAGIAARLGGDEFVVLVEDLQPDAVQALSERLLRELREPVTLGGYTVTTTVSIGLASAVDSSETSTLLRDADVALYRAKDAGRDRFAWFDSEAHEDLLQRIRLERDLRAALTSGEIAVHYQPLFSLEHGEARGVEALARWTHPVRGSISPGTFIPLAEDAGLINLLGRHVARIAAEQAARWVGIPDFTVWVNISGRQFSTSRVADDLLQVLADTGLAPERLGVEVTETVLADETVAVRTLRTLAAEGVRVAIDDFGTGYSSIARLSSLPVSVLKIDRSFVAEAETLRGRATLDAIVHLARALDMRTVAEGIETPRQLEIVREAGVTSASGYLLARPAPAEALVRRMPGS
ncbi:MAG TPA: EAL domain-containing protein [Rhodoglobus sp.]|nr:EAL domain-containing protein [Rhodoglobus sp.]